MLGRVLFWGLAELISIRWAVGRRWLAERPKATRHAAPSPPPRPLPRSPPLSRASNSLRWRETNRWSDVPLSLSRSCFVSLFFVVEAPPTRSLDCDRCGSRFWFRFADFSPTATPSSSLIGRPPQAPPSRFAIGQIANFSADNWNTCPADATFDALWMKFGSRRGRRTKKRTDNECVPIEKKGITKERTREESRWYKKKDENKFFFVFYLRNVRGEKRRWPFREKWWAGMRSGPAIDERHVITIGSNHETPMTAVPQHLTSLLFLFFSSSSSFFFFPTVPHWFRYARKPGTTR